MAGMKLWIDTHCHLDAAEFGGLSQAVRAAALQAGVGHVVIPAVQRSNWLDVVALARVTGDSFALGIHPLYTPQADTTDVQHLRTLQEQYRGEPQLVAVGEIGLDFFVPGLDAERQIWFYEQQVQVARDLALPVILHVRKSSDRLLKTLRATPVVGGIAHAFNGSWQQAQAFIDLGFKLGFGGAVTYDRALKLRELAAKLPLESIVMETDAPDILPHWLYTTAQQRAQGQPQGRNSPAELPRIAHTVAGLRGITTQALAQATSQNARAALRGLPAFSVF